MTEEKKAVRKNPHPLVIKGIFYVTADYDDKQYVVSNGLSFIRFKKEGEPEISKGDYIRVHAPVYKKKDAAQPIIIGEAIIEKLTDEEVDKYKAETAKAVAANSKGTDKKKTTTKKTKEEDQKFPWED